MDIIFASAIQMQRGGQPTAAADLCHQILARDPQHTGALRLLGHIHLEAREPLRAVGFLNRAVAFMPEAESYVMLAEAHHALGQHEQAAVSAREALRQSPDSVDALRILNAAERGLKQRDQAIDDLLRQARSRRDASIHVQVANLLRQAGRTEEALQHFQRAAKLAPGDAVMHANLGQIFLNLNRVEEALASCRRAVALNPQTPALHLILGDALRRTERFGEARAAYREAARLQPTLARAHANLGLLLRAEKKMPDAFAPLNQALALEPNNPWFWRYLAEAHAEWEDFSEAIRCWQQAAALEPLQAAMQIGVGAALMEAGRFDEAEAHLRLALRLQPNSDEAQIALGDVHQRRGEDKEAEAAFRAAWHLRSAQVQAPARLARLLGSHLPEDDLTRIQKQSAESGRADADRATLIYALANALDQRKRYPEAADYASQANALNLKLMHRRREYSPQSHREFVAGLIGTFDADFFARPAGGGAASDRPVFIVGLERSGTTLVEQILASHPRIHGAGELQFGWQSFTDIPATLGQKGDALVLAPRLEAKSLGRLAEQHLGWLAARTPASAERIVDKMPANYHYLGLLAAMFPRATFIHCRRDLRDVAVSCWFTQFQWLKWTSDFKHIATRFEDYLTLMNHWQAVLPVRLHEVRYEDLVNNLEATARRLVAACGMDWDPACLDFHRNRRPVRTSSLFQVRKPIYQNAVGRWRHYEAPLAKLFARLPSPA